jgi:protein dithiol:quinone oxidoreductase
MIKITHSKTAWLLLAVTALGLELTALYFQYVLYLEPCVLCVYERGAVALIIIAGILGLIDPNNGLLRLGGYILWVGGAIWGLYLTIKHAGIQMGLIQDSASCDFIANFPAWLQLDQWIPWLFNPTGYCEDVQWQFLGMSMPQSMVMVNAIYLIVLVMVLVSEYRQSRRKRFV